MDVHAKTDPAKQHTAPLTPAHFSYPKGNNMDALTSDTIITVAIIAAVCFIAWMWLRD